MKLYETDMKFYEAVRAIRAGKRVTREEWNDENKYFELASNISYKNIDGETVNCNNKNYAIAFVNHDFVKVYTSLQVDLGKDYTLYSELEPSLEDLDADDYKVI